MQYFPFAFIKWEPVLALYPFWANFFYLQGQLKFEEVTRRAQEQFQMVLEEQSRYPLLFSFFLSLQGFDFSVLYVHTYENFLYLSSQSYA